MRRLTLQFAAVLAAATAAVAQERVIIASRTLMPDGSLVPGKAVVVTNGRISRLADAAEFDDRADVFRTDGVLSPGLIDCLSDIGARGHTASRIASVDPEPMAHEALDPHAQEVAEALRQGVTTLMLAPEPTSLIGGRCSVVRTRPYPHGRAEVLRTDAGQTLNMGEWAFSASREPSSRAGAMFMLRDLYDRVRRGERLPLIEKMYAGGPCIARCELGQDVSAVLRLFSGKRTSPVIVHSRDLVDVASEIAAFESMLIVGPISFNAGRRELAGIARAADTGVVIGFSAWGDPDADSLRRTAAAAADAGMTPDAARRALTSDAARIIGLHGTLGSIAPGQSADLVVFSHDPLRPDSRPLAVWVAGELVHAHTGNEAEELVDHLWNGGAK